MNGIISGASLSTYRTVKLSINQAKKENRDGVKSRFITASIKDADSFIAKTTRIVVFEEELPEGSMDILKNYIKVNDAGEKQKDERGGFIIDLKALKSGSDGDDFEGLLNIKGGMVMEYPLKKGACYANDVDGNRTKDGSNNDVVKDTISVFVQVKNMMPTENGGLKPIFIDGWSLEERGSRMEARFYREPVVKVLQAETEKSAEEESPF